MKKAYLLVFPVITIIIFSFLYLRSKYSFEGDSCGGFTANPKKCAGKLKCQYPWPPKGIDTDFGICVKECIYEAGCVED